MVISRFWGRLFEWSVATWPEMTRKRGTRLQHDVTNGSSLTNRMNRFSLKKPGFATKEVTGFTFL
jgi:hypothetical protein